MTLLKEIFFKNVLYFFWQKSLSNIFEKFCIFLKKKLENILLIDCLKYIMIILININNK